MKCQLACLFLVSLTLLPLPALEPSVVLNLWPEKPPGNEPELPPEADLTKPEDRLIAGRRIIKLGNVSTPQLAVYRPPAEKDTGAAVVICPGGGHHILAYDLEGTEVAEWLNQLGVTGIVLKYRVPFRDKDQRWLAAVQDGQRAMSLTRSHAKAWGIDPERVGMLGFSAGGQLAGFVSFLKEKQRQYDRVDEVDDLSWSPDFSVLVYPARLLSEDEKALHPLLEVTPKSPPTFFVHAANDGVSSLNSLMVAAELKRANVSSEVHIYAKGGHGYGLRPVEGVPVTRWSDVCAKWLEAEGFLKN